MRIAVREELIEREALEQFVELIGRESLTPVSRWVARVIGELN
jgi:hypothetical protein